MKVVAPITFKVLYIASHLFKPILKTLFVLTRVVTSLQSNITMHHPLIIYLFGGRLGIISELLWLDFFLLNNSTTDLDDNLYLFVIVHRVYNLKNKQWN